jgi:endonuclease-3
MARGKINKIIELLTQEYGNKEWKLNRDPVSVLVQTILSQNTSDRNSDRAFLSLKNTFAGWRSVARAKIDRIAGEIKGGGLAEAKARYIKQALIEIESKQGKLELDFLKELTPEEARRWLMQLSGVGMKTANCVLLFSLGMPALPVDTHIFRLSKRLGLIDEKTSIDQAHRLLEKMVPPELMYKFHVLLIEHGRKICKAPRPLCKQCILRQMCPYYNEQKRLSLKAGIKKEKNQ